MIFIIDAYNVLKLWHAETFISDKQKVAFIKIVERYIRSKDHRALVVFDGGAYKWPTVNKDKQLTVVYSGTYLNADEYIKDYIEGIEHKDALLVSSDRVLIEYAAHYQIPSLGSQDFIKLLKEFLGIAQKAQVSKRDYVKKYVHSDFDPALDELMESAVVSSKVEKEKVPQKNSKAQELSKWEKKLLKIVKKI